MREQYQNIIEVVRDGVDIETAASLCGVRFSKIIVLLRDGEVEAERRERGLKPRSSYNEAHDFTVEATRAKAAAMTKMIRGVNKQGETDWKAYKYLLGTMDERYEG